MLVRATEKQRYGRLQKFFQQGKWAI